MGKSSFKRNTFFLLSGTILNKGLQFLAIPFFSRWLSTEEYGQFDLLYTYISLLLPIITLCTQESVFRLSLGRVGLKEKKAYISTGFAIDIINFAIFVLITYFILIAGRRSRSLYIAFVLYLLAESWSVYLKGYLRAIKRLDIYSLSLVISTVFMIVFVSIFILVLYLVMRLAG